MIGFPLLMIALLAVAALMGMVSAGWVADATADAFLRRAMMLYMLGLLAFFVEMFL